MKNTINVNGNYILAYAYDCGNTNGVYYDIYDNEENWLGEIPYSEIADDFIDEETEEYDLVGLEILIRCIID